VKKILVLGHSGMLGHMVKRYLSNKNDFSVFTTNLKWPNNDFKKEIISFSSQSNAHLINCIGAIPQKVDSFNINSDLPIWLENNINSYRCKIIHPGTDCEVDNDKYGISKKKASNYIIKNGKITKIIKASIIGPELLTKHSLFEWFLNCQEEEVDGYTQFFWNGITTLQWAYICYDLIINWNKFKILTIPATDCISKYDLLVKVKTVFNKKIKINKNMKIKANKCLIGNYKVPTIDNQLLKLKKQMNENKN
tara:strand:- start:756 stop:1508 length:753 start_codon:yes stop_codon:yes gene_type:complete